MSTNKPVELGKASKQTQEPGPISMPDSPGVFTDRPPA